MPAPHAVRSGQQPQLGVGQERNGTREREDGSSARPYRGPPPDLGGQGSGWEEAPGGGVHALPGPCPPGTSLEETCPVRWETGPGWREKCPEKRTVPVGSGDVCSTVHGSYQLSTDHPPTPALTASRPVQPQPHTCMQTRRHHQTIPGPLGAWSWLVPISPIKPKGNKLFKNPHPQILHAILGQMNKQKLLLLTFMQNNRKGRLGVCPTAVTARKGWPPGTQEVTSPLHGPGPLRSQATPAQGLSPICSGGWL